MAGNLGDFLLYFSDVIENSSNVIDKQQFVSLEEEYQEIQEPFFFLENQPLPVQRKSYPTAKRKEMRQFKPAVLRVVPNHKLLPLLQHGTAVMNMVNEYGELVAEHSPLVSEMDRTKCFWFHPKAYRTSKGKYYRLEFSINFLLEDGQQKKAVVRSNRFRVVSRITANHLIEITHTE